jgi:hypothetical protein
MSSLRIVLGLLACVALAGAPGCSEPTTEADDVGEGEEALRNAFAEPNGPAGIVAIDTRSIVHGEEWVYSCAGVIVAPDAMLTAEQCAYFATDVPEAGRGMDVTFWNGERSFSTVVIRSVDVKPCLPNDCEGRDRIALAFLRDPVPFPALRLADETPRALDSVKIYGFGSRDSRRHLQSVTFRWGPGVSVADPWDEIGSPVLKGDEVVGIYTGYRWESLPGRILFGEDVIVPVVPRDGGESIKQKVDELLAARR